MQLYEPLVLAWCRLRGLQTADALDVAQEVFIAVANGLEHFTNQPGKTFRGWLWTITRCKTMDRWRRRDVVDGQGGSSANEALHQLADDAQDSGMALSEEKMLLYRQALSLIQRDFEVQTWRVFWRVVIDDVPPKDVANEFGITVNAVHLAKSRIKARLREEFVGLIDPDETGKE